MKNKTPLIDASRTKRNPIISMRNICKSFPLVQANDHIDIDIFPHEIHALLGENGAGKSTLMKILYGFYQADSGSILYKGKQIAIRSPHDAMDINIGMVFQDLIVVPAFSVTENIALFIKDLKFIYSNNEIRNQIIETSKRYGLEIDPDIKAVNLSIGELQKVEIIKLLMSNAKLLILDEPTRVLAPHEIDAFFKILQKLRDDGFAIVLITHKLHEVINFANQVTVLRKGVVSGTLVPAQITEEKLIHLMFAKELNGYEKSKSKTQKLDTPALNLVDVETKGENSANKLQKINMEIFQGEVVGVAGVSGNGQKELVDVILGMEHFVSGKKYLFEKDATNWSIAKLRKNGVALIPENPLNMAVAGWLPVLTNMIISRMWSYSLWHGFRINWQKAVDDAKSAFKKLGFDMPNLSTPAMSLSGGNLQRMTIAREIYFRPKLIIASYFTRGLDVQSALAAQTALCDARDNGAGVLLISEDLEELFLLSDRLLILYEGRIVGEFLPEETNIFEVGHLMTGSKVTANG